MERGKYSKAEAVRYEILAVQRQGNRLLNNFLKEIGLTASQAEVLRILDEWKTLSLKDLGHLLICESGSPSRLLDRMTADGLVEKVVDPKDSRYVILQLTAQGLEKAKLVEGIEQRLYEQLMQLYSEEELETINSLLFRFLKGQALADTLKRRGYEP
ncbi:MarR family winged helix-turn-helix transcriptional regulator [Paenibacillus durus]|uniref:HTH marR-type domain-containing protein n=1 Tax=Paenibacillus durus ATCC 35681 TaxID=1333534 RepID=A0A0F7CGU8_PAEDU|nr:winged helix DNA-binding protein [Paenibacillus durus]AKG33821.1 hypothetical protein VK70_03830 [Paenibacillus durus ATCC 35681]